MSLLWIFISNRSQVLEPSPQGLHTGKRVRVGRGESALCDNEESGAERGRWEEVVEGEGERGREGERERDERLPGGDLEDLSGHPDGSLDSEILVLGSVDEIVGD